MNIDNKTDMQVTAWNNGKHHKSGAGYGLKISKKDRDVFFEPSIKSIFLFLGDKSKAISVNTNKPSFWGDKCRELISKEIGVWLKEIGYAPWEKNNPPKLHMRKVSENTFLVIP